MTARPLPVLRGSRVDLRQLAPQDADAFVAGVRASGELHSSWVSPARDRAGYEAYLARIGQDFAPFGVFCQADGHLAGVFNVSQIYLGFFCSASLGYFAFAPHARKGFMREGLELLLHMAFEQLSLHRIEANVQPENLASIALVRRCGFEHEGYSRDFLFIAGAWRDHERWAMRREIWR